MITVSTGKKLTPERYAIGHMHARASSRANVRILIALLERTILFRNEDVQKRAWTETSMFKSSKCVHPNGTPRVENCVQTRALCNDVTARVIYLWMLNRVLLSACNLYHLSQSCDGATILRNQLEPFQCIPIIND
jgi:hypothetical protein